MAMVAIVGATGAAGAEVKPDKAAPAIVAVFALNGELQEKPAGDDFLFGAQGAQPLQDLIKRLRQAREDKQIKAVVILLGQARFDLAQAEELRGEMQRFKTAHKPVYAHADGLNLRSYLLLSSASRLSVAPTGSVWTMGLYGETPYLRGLLDKLGVTPDFLTCGAYKSAGEIFMRTGPSPEAEKMENWLLDSIYDSILSQIAEGRGTKPEKVRQWVDSAPYSAEEAQKLGMIDAVQTRQELADALKKTYGDRMKLERRYGRRKAPEVDLSSPLGVFKLWADLLGESPRAKERKDAVGIVYVDGPILLGRSQPSPFGAESGAYSSDVSRALVEAADDDSVKAVVLRVSSPGGSATASEIILNAARRVKAKKPLVVSMGGVAGSGGYYVACAADTICADRSTITASIGVVGGKFATTPLWNKVGIHWKANARGKNASMLSSAEAFSTEQRKKLQAHMDEIYRVFKGHVVANRGKRLKKPIDEVAGGRVFTGAQALELGLVDKLAGLDEAIRQAASEAKIKDYQVRAIPKPKGFLETLVEEMSGDKEQEGKSLSLDNRLQPASFSHPLLDAALPHLQQLEPQRVAAVRRALQRLSLIQQEGVLMMMPEVYWPR